MNILITSAGRRVELVQAFRDDLSVHFPGAKVFATDIQPMLSAACQVADGYWVVPMVTDAHYLDVLLDLCLQNHIRIVVPTIDAELMVLAEGRKWFENEGIHIIISSKDLISHCRDKRKTASIFKCIGINTPEIYRRSALSFPCFVKPYDGSCSIGAEALLTEKALTSKHLEDKKMMFMEFIDDQHTEFTVDAYYSKEGDLKCLIPRERIEVRGGEVSKGVVRKGEIYDYLLPKCKKIIGARGCLTIQVFANIKQGSFYGLEINPRFGGGFPLSYSAGGYYPSWLISEYLLGNKIDFYDQWESNLLMLRYDAKELVSGYV